MAKKWYLSKTLYVNVLTVAAAMLAYIASVGGDLHLDGETVAVLTAVVGLINIGLRFLTSQPLSR